MRGGGIAFRTDREHEQVCVLGVEQGSLAARASRTPPVPGVPVLSSTKCSSSHFSEAIRKEA